MEFLFDCLFDFSLTHEWENRTLTSKNLYHIFLLIKNALDYPFFSHQRMGWEKKFIKMYIYMFIFLSEPILDGAFFTATMNDNQKVMRVHVGEDKSFDFFISHWLMSEKTEFWRQGIYIMFVCLSKNHLDYPFFSFLYIFFPSPSLMAHFSLPPWTTIKKWCVST